MFSSLKPLPSDLIDTVTGRRDVLRRMGGVAGVAALASVPVLAIVKDALAASGNARRVNDVLNFALTLEYLEESYYRQGLATSGLIPSDVRPVFDQIQKHEDAHVTFLRAAIESIGEEPVTFMDDDFDFTAGGFNPFDDINLFMALAQGFEDTGVRAYKGQAANLYAQGERVNPTLTAALQIHSVEARHASEVRRMRGEKGWVVGDGTQGLPEDFAAIYAGEADVSHGGINVANESSVSRQAVTEAFDEPLTDDEVLAIAGPFIESEED